MAVWVKEDSMACVVVSREAIQVEADIADKVATMATESIGCREDSHSRECTHSRSSGQT